MQVSSLLTLLWFGKISQIRHALKKLTINKMIGKFDYILLRKKYQKKKKVEI